MVGKEDVSLINHQVDAITERKAAVKPAMRTLYEVYNDYSKQFFPEESDEAGTRVLARSFVNTLLAFVLPEIEHSVDERENLEEQVVLRAATSDFIRQLYEEQIGDSDLTLRHVLGEAKRQYSLVAQQIAVQNESGIDECMRGAKLDEHGLLVYNTIIGLIQGLIDPTVVVDVTPIKNPDGQE